MFINNDINFIALNQSLTKYEIYDASSYIIIDSLEYDSIKIPKYSRASISKDEKYLISPINRGFRIWDLNTKRISKTKIYLDETNLMNVGIGRINFNCDNTKIIAQLAKTYFNPNDPPHPITIGGFIIYDFNTLDSLDCLGNANYFKISNTCKYITFKTGDPTYGVEVYEFNSKELLWTIPINGPSLTGIEFSPDDKYLITSPTIQIWDMETGKQTYSYQSGSANTIDVSSDGKYIGSSIGRYFYKWNARFGTSIVPEDRVITPQIIYPNPSTGIAIIQYQQPVSEMTNIFITDINGQIVKPIFNNFLEEGQKIIDFNTQDISNGTYFVKVENSHLSLTFKLIVNK
jgi:hypothetical protein